MPKIAIVIPADLDYEEVWNITYPNVEQYGQKHSYDIIRIKESGDRGMPWHKILMASEIVKLYDWILMRGVDFLVMNPNIPLEDFIDDKYDMIVSEDCHGINFDAVLIKNSDWSQKYLKYIYDEGYKKYNHDCWKEQRCVIETHNNPEWKNHIKVIPQQSFNSYNYSWYGRSENETGQFKQGDLHLHFVGLSNEERVKKMNDWLLAVENIKN